jgi:hypothetical protein
LYENINVIVINNKLNQYLIVRFLSMQMGWGLMDGLVLYCLTKREVSYGKVKMLGEMGLIMMKAFVKR